MTSSAQIRLERKGISTLCVGIAFLVFTAALTAQQTNPPPIAPRDLMRAVVDKEMAAARKQSTKFLFCSRRTTQKGVQEKIYIQANEGVASIILADTGQALSPQQQREQADQLVQIASHPDRLRRKQEREKQEFEHTLRILHALPDAFLYDYAPAQPGDNQAGEDPVARMNFRPNPGFSPPSTVEQVLTGMQGYILIDTKAQRLVRIDGTLFKDVNFGWGIFGRLDKGGTFRVQQADQGGGNWMITEMSLRLTGKILLIKSLNLNSDEIFSDFRRMPDDLSFAKAVDMLQNEQIRLAQNTHLVRASGQ